MTAPLVLTPAEAVSAALGLIMSVGYLLTPAPDLKWHEKVLGSATIGAVFGGLVLGYCWLCSAGMTMLPQVLAEVSRVVVVRP